MTPIQDTFQKLLVQASSGRLRRFQDPSHPGAWFFEVPTELFVARIDVAMPPLPPVALYVLKDNHFEMLRAADQPYSMLALSLHPSTWVRESDLLAIRKHAQAILLKPQDSQALPMEARMAALRQAAIQTVEELFENPTPEKITESQQIVSSFVHVLMKEPNAYTFLARLSSHDPYTLQHSVGTSVNCIILGRKLGINDEIELMELGMAGLLHDIGKTRVRKELINKTGPLTEDEWEEMRRHAIEGYLIVRNHPHLSERTKLAILEHHEDKMGTGYPHLLTADQTQFFSKIVCISDIFNALTTNRSYSKARTPFEAFHFMKEKLKHKIDEELFKHLVLIYGGELPS